MQSKLVDSRFPRVHFARARNGSCPAEEFLQDLARSNDKESRASLARFHAYVVQIGQGGRLTPKQFKKLEGNIWEFRISRKAPRVLCFMEHGHYVLTHGFMKKQDKVPRQEIDRAERIRQECLEGG